MIVRCGTPNIKDGRLCQLPAGHTGNHSDVDRDQPATMYQPVFVPIAYPWFMFWRGRWAWLWILGFIFISIVAGVQNASLMNLNSDCTTSISTSGTPGDSTYHSTTNCK